MRAAINGSKAPFAYLISYGKGAYRFVTRPRAS